MKKNRNNPLTVRAALFGQPATINKEARTVDFVLSTGNNVRVFDFNEWRAIDEILVPESMYLPGDRKQVPLLDTHDSSSIQNIFGSVRNIRVEGNAVIGTLHFMTDDESQRAFEAVSEGHLTDGSVGYVIEEYRELEEGETFEFAGRSYNGNEVDRVVTKWKLKEFSLAPIGADEGAKARNNKISQEDRNVEENKTPEIVEKQAKAPETTETAETTEKTEEVIEQKSVNVEEIEARAAEKVTARIKTIRTEARALGFEEAEIDELANIVDLNEARAQMIERKSKMTVVPNTNRVEIGAEDSEKFKRAAVDSLLLRAGMKVKDAAPGARDVSFGFKSLARECLDRAGINHRGWSDEKIFKVALGRSMPWQGTSDFSNIVMDASNKSVMMGWEAIPSTFEQWCKIGSVSDFKAHNRIRLSDSPEMSKVLENGELPRVNFSDSKAYVSAETRGLVTGVSRQALMNDDLGILNDMGMAIGARSRQQVNAYAYSLLDSNLLYDGTSAIFSAGNGNLATSAAAPNATTLSAMRVAMMTQTDIKGTKLNNQPRYILCGPEQADNLFIILNSERLPDSENGANPFFNMAQPIVDANIDGKEWYGIVDPMFPTVEIVFLNGQRVPVMEELPPSEILGISMRAYLDWGGAVLDYRGIYKNAGE